MKKVSGIAWLISHPLGVNQVPDLIQGSSRVFAVLREEAVARVLWSDPPQAVWP